MQTSDQSDKDYYFLENLRIFVVSVPIVFIILFYLNIMVFNLADKSNVGANFVFFIISGIIVYYIYNLNFVLRHTRLLQK